MACHCKRKSIGQQRSLFSSGTGKRHRKWKRIKSHRRRVSGMSVGDMLVYGIGAVVLGKFI